MIKYLHKLVKIRAKYAFKKEKRENIEEQCCPNYEDISAATKLRNNLRSDDFINYVSNVLEWEDKNIQYWYERSDLDLTKNIGLTISLTPFFCAAIIGMMLSIESLFQISKLTNFTYFLFNCVVILIPIVFVIWVVWYMCIKFYQSSRNYHFILKNNINEDSVKRKIGKLQYQKYLSVEEILRYKSAVCRDYAKLSCAVLLASEFFEDFLYIITLPNHSACAIKYKTTYYIMDQTLPLKQIDMWLIYKREKKANLYKLKVNRPHKKISLESAISYKLSTNSVTNKPEVNVAYIEKEISKIYNTSNSKIGVEIIIKIDKYFDNTNKVTYYDDVTSNSFIRMIKKEIDDNLCSNVSHINTIKVLPDCRYIILQLYACIK